MSDTLIAAFFGIPLALMSYWLQAFFARRAELAKFERDNKREVYNHFVTTLVGMGMTRPGTPENLQYSKALLEARARIILYGSSEVVEKLADFWTNPVLDNDESYNRLTAAVEMMRCDIGAAVSADFEKQVKAILFAKFAGTGTSRD